MTRQHASRYQAPADPYAAARCGCGHIFYADDQLGRPCRFFAEGCPCMSHRPAQQAGGDDDAAA
jgi:hypothetical protein